MGPRNHPEKATSSELVIRDLAIERTFVWLGRCRRLSKDCEETIPSREAFAKLAMIRQMARELVEKLEG